MTDLDLTQPATPSLTINRALIIFIASILAMIPGWILGAHIPLWFAPPVETLGSTFLFYLLTPCLIWGCVPFLLFRRWKISFSADDSNNWMVRYVLLFVTWSIIFFYTFSQWHEEPNFYNFLFSQPIIECLSTHAENGNVTYICTTECNDFGCWPSLPHP